MGRAKEFDNETVLEQATRLFWRLGYDAVTIQDLEAATGLGRGSLYNAFGDKEGLFLAAFDSYVGSYGTAPLARLEYPDVAEGIRRMFKAIIARMSDPQNPRGCLLTNTSLAAVASSKRIEARVAESLRAMDARLEAAIERARRTGQIPADADPRTLARFYGAVAQSLSVEHKVFGDRSALNEIVATAMQVWPGRRPRVAAHRGKKRAGGSRRKAS